MADPTTEHSLPAIYMYYLAGLVERWDVSGPAILAGTGLSVDDLAVPGASLPIGQVIDIVERARALTGEPALGFFWGMQMKVSWHGFLGFAAMAAATVGAAIELAAKYAPTRTSALELRLERGESEAALVIEERAPLGAARDAVIVALVVGLWQIGNSMTGKNLAGAAELAIPEPAYAAPFSAALASRVSFDCAEHRMIFSPDVLELPLVMADPGALELARRQCQRELDAITGESGVVGKVRALVAEVDAGGIDDVAKTLGMSARTLKRRLSEHDTSFSALVTEARRSLAIQLLRTDASIESIAERVGYADAQSFARAFRRWTGKAPTAFRRLVSR